MGLLLGLKGSAVPGHGNSDEERSALQEPDVLCRNRDNSSAETERAISITRVGG